MKIKNKVSELSYVTLDELKDFEFNSIKEENRDISKLKELIKKDGFSFPLFVWKEGKYVIDGTGRYKALLELIEEGYEIEKIPVVYIKAESREEAIRLVLAINSQFGEITDISLTEFLNDLDFDIDLGEFELGNVEPISFDEEIIEEDEITRLDKEQVPTIEKLAIMYDKILRDRHKIYGEEEFNQLTEEVKMEIFGNQANKS